MDGCLPICVANGTAGTKFFLALLAGVLCAGLPFVRADDDDGAATANAPGRLQADYDLFHPVPKNKMREFDADRPDQVDDPYTIDAGHFQLEMDFANYTLDHHTPERDGTRIDQWNIAPASLRIGVLPNVELDLGYDGYFNTRTRDLTIRADRTQSGFGSFTLQSKINLFGNDDGKVAFGLIPFLRLPTSTAGLASHSVEGGLGLTFGAKLPWDFELTVGSGFAAVRNDSDAYYVASFENGVSISHGLGIKRLSGFVEFFSEFTTESPSPVSGQVDTGVTYQLRENVQIDLDCYFGVTRAAPDYVPFAGLTVRF